MSFDRLYYQRNRESILAKGREHYHRNKDAIKLKRKQVRDKNLQKYRDHQSRYYLKNREKVLARNAEYYKRNKARKIAKFYGISEEQYNSMLNTQRGLCAICGSSGGKRGLCLDHCHTSGEIRALLCMHCNIMLGMAQDSARKLQDAIKYLQDHSIKSIGKSV